VKHLSGTSLLERLPAVPTHNRLAWKSLPGTNTLAFLLFLNYVQKMFYTLATGVFSNDCDFECPEKTGSFADPCTCRYQVMFYPVTCCPVTCYPVTCYPVTCYPVTYWPVSFHSVTCYLVIFKSVACYPATLLCSSL
jgi:hypothetical protein